MNLLTIAWKNLQARSLSSSLTALSIALGVMLMVAVLVIFGVVEKTFNQNSINYDLIVGPKGSDLQLVLSTVYHVAPPVENLPYRYYKQLQKDPRVQTAIPLAFGDRTEQGGFPIVGTIPKYFDIDYAPRRPFRFKGDFLRQPFDAVIGSNVAKTNGWALGTEFKMVHGGTDGHVHDEKFTVKGILAPTGTPHDKTVYVHLDGFYMIDGHDKPMDEAITREREFFGEPPLSAAELAAEIKRLGGDDHHHHHDHAGHDHFHSIPDVQKQVTSIFVQTKTELAAAMMAADLKKGLQSQAVNPVIPMQRLFNDVLGNVRTLLVVLTSLIVVVSGIGIFVSIYNTMAARRREIAIFRALGAGRSTVFGIVLLEAILLCLGGGLLGLLLGHGLVAVASPIVEQRSGVIIDPFAYSIWEAVMLPSLIALGFVVGAIPALTAYRTDVAQSLNS